MFLFLAVVSIVTCFHLSLSFDNDHILSLIRKYQENDRYKRYSFSPIHIPSNKTIGPAKRYLLEQTKYNKNVRPVRSNSSSTPIELSIYVNHMDSLDEIQQTMTIHALIYYSWNDEYLVFYHNEYTELWFRPVDIWTPTIQVLQRAESEYSFKGIQSTLTVVMSGTVFFFQPATFKVTCKFDFTNYPFDKQSCPVVFTSRDGRIGDAPLTWPNVYGPKAITFLSDSFQIIPEVNPTNKSSRGYYAGGWKLLNAWNNTKYGYHGSLFS